MARLLLLFTWWAWATWAAAASPVVVNIALIDEDQREVHVVLPNDAEHRLLVRRDRDMFDEDSRLVVHGQDEHETMATSSAYSTPPDQLSAGNWAAVSIRTGSSGEWQVRGVVSLDGVMMHVSPVKGKKHRAVPTHLTPEDLAQGRRDLSGYSPGSDFQDEVLEVPSKGKTTTTARLRGGGAQRTVARQTPRPTPDHSEYEVSPSGQAYSSTGTPFKFYPACYPGDSAGATVKISIAIDWGYQVKVHGGDVSQQSKVLDEMEQIVAVARVIYLAQLNVQLRVQDVVLGRSNSPAPLNGLQNTATCRTAVFDTLDTFSGLTQALNKPSAHWHLLTACYEPPGAIGIAYRNTLCDTKYGVAVSSRSGTDGAWTWLTFSHELGHSFGASHSFERGVGTTGGIMDYGNGKVGGTVEFHPNKRAEVCDGMTRGLATKCPYIVLGDPNSSSQQCGNGVLEPDEKCECLQKGSKSCGACVNCLLTRRVSCSSSQFVMRFPDTSAYAIADEALLASPDCCNADGTLAPPKTTCNNGRDVCTKYGTCSRVCSAYALTPCGWDDSGCMQSCLRGNQCKNDIMTLGPPPIPVSAVKDGTLCFLRTGATTKFGRCMAGGCKASADVDGVPTATPTARTTDDDVSPPPSASGGGGGLPACPSVMALARCSSAKVRGQCVGACTWCQNKCVASPLLCGSASPASVVFAHCPPFAPPQEETTDPPSSKGPDSSSAEFDCPPPRAVSTCLTLGRKACIAAPECTYCGGRGVCVAGRTAEYCEAAVVARVKEDCPGA